MRGKITFLVAGLALCLAAVATVGAGPRQEKPPQPFGPDSFSGQVSVQGALAPAGLQLYACIESCEVYLSAAVEIEGGGAYSKLVISPLDRSLVGHPVFFYLANKFGRIRAAEVVDFQGATQIFDRNLTFSDPVPSPTATPTVTPTASLPAPGDPTIPAIPKIALLFGVVALFAGVVLLLNLRRRAV